MAKQYIKNVFKKNKQKQQQQKQREIARWNFRMFRFYECMRFWKVMRGNFRIYVFKKHVMFTRPYSIALDIPVNKTFTSAHFLFILEIPDHRRANS